MNVSEGVKEKIAEAIELWRDENLEGKPTLLANATYFSVVKFLEDKTKEIEEKFGTYKY